VGEGRMSCLTFDTSCRDSCCYCMTTMGGVMGSGQAESVSDTAPAAHIHAWTCARAAGTLPALKSIETNSTHVLSGSYS